MIRRASMPLLCLAVLLPVVAAAADEGEDRIERIRRRMDEVLSRESDALRSGVRELVAKELGGGEASGRPASRPEASHPSAPEAAAAITAAELMAHVEQLASDEFEGRGSTQRGLWRAARYLTGEMERLGLEPAGTDGYLQRFRIGKAEAANVVGLVPGSDPELRDEVVVVGAHFDHLGKGKGVGAGRMDQIGGDRSGGDRIYNGADDNASGTAAVLEIAGALAAAPPRRSVLLILFAGEELGLLGSRHFVQHPTVPLERVVAMVNLDMVGRNPKRALEVIAANSAKELNAAFAEAARAQDVRVRFTGQGLMGGSDHQSFYPKKIPVAHVFSGLHKDYHAASDEVERVSPEQMERAARLVADAVARVANLNRRPRFRTVPSMELSRLLELFAGGGGEGGRTFGISAAPPGDAAESGILVQEVVPGSAAEECGVKAGDVLIGFAGARLDGSYERALERLRGEIAEAPAGGDVEVRVVRAGRTLELTAQFEE